MELMFTVSVIAFDWNFDTIMIWSPSERSSTLLTIVYSFDSVVCACTHNGNSDNNNRITENCLILFNCFILDFLLLFMYVRFKSQAKVQIIIDTSML